MQVTDELAAVILCFKGIEEQIASPHQMLSSNQVMAKLKPPLEKLGFRIEAGKRANEKIKVPVLFGLNNRIDKYFDADGVGGNGRIAIEVEAGRAVDNYHFLKDIFVASMMAGVEILVLAVRNHYRHSKDFHKVYVFLETMFISSRIQLPLKGILLIGY